MSEPLCILRRNGNFWKKYSKERQEIELNTVPIFLYVLIFSKPINNRAHSNVHWPFTENKNNETGIERND